MSAPAFSEWGAQTFSIIVPWDAMGNRTHLGESASVVEIAPMRYGNTLFDSPYFAEEKGKGGFVHPMLRDDQISNAFATRSRCTTFTGGSPSFA